MPVHVVNWTDAEIGSAVAGANMDQGVVCLVTASGTNRELNVVLDTEDADVLPGNYAVAMKMSSDPDFVDSSSAAAATGDRTDPILAGDVIMEVQRGAILEYTADLLDDSLDPGRGGATPAIGDDLGIQGGKWATITAATSSGIASPVVARVHKVFGTRVQIRLV